MTNRTETGENTMTTQRPKPPNISAVSPSPLCCALVHKFMTEHGIIPDLVVIAASATATGMYDFDEDERVAWLANIAENGWLDPEMINNARKAFAEHAEAVNAMRQ